MKASEARAELAALPAEASVTADDLAREAALGQSVLIAAGAADAARTTREALDTELAAATYRADVLDRAAEIDAAVTAAAAWQSRRADIDERRRQRTAARISIDAVLAEAGWDEARLASADPAQVRASVVAHARDDLDVPARATAAPAERARTAAEDVARVRRQVVDLEASLASAPAVDAAAADELDRQARGVLDDLTRISSMRAAIEAAAPPMVQLQAAVPASSAPRAVTGRRMVTGWRRSDRAGPGARRGGIAGRRDRRRHPRPGRPSPPSAPASCSGRGVRRRRSPSRRHPRRPPSTR